MAKTPSPEPVAQPVPEESPQHQRGRAILKEIVALYFDTYPDFRPNFTECTILTGLLYSVAVKHQISPGQYKHLEMLRKKLVSKGIIKEAA